jgi:hypothetical protein
MGACTGGCRKGFDGSSAPRRYDSSGSTGTAAESALAAAPLVISPTARLAVCPQHSSSCALATVVANASSAIKRRQIE